MELAKPSSPNLEYNLAGELLLTVRESDLQVLTKELVTSGYRYGCVLPFRGLMKDEAIENLRDSSLSIVHLEEAGNPTKWDSRVLAVMAGLYGQVLELAKLRKQEPILQDALFPGKVTCKRLFDELLEVFPDSKFIAHDVNFDFPPERILIEINKGVSISPDKLLELSEEEGFGLVFDPSHLLVPERIFSAAGEPAKVYKGEWERQFNQFASQVEVVDINPTGPNDVADLVKGGGLLKEVEEAAKETGKVKFLRVEVQVPVKWQIPVKGQDSDHQKGFDFLQAIGQRLMEG